MNIKSYRVFREHMSQKEHIHAKDHSLKIAVSLNLLSTLFHRLGPWYRILLHPYLELYLGCTSIFNFLLLDWRLTWKNRRFPQHSIKSNQTRRHANTPQKTPNSFSADKFKTIKNWRKISGVIGTFLSTCSDWSIFIPFTNDVTSQLSIRVSRSPRNIHPHVKVPQNF